MSVFPFECAVTNLSKHFLPVTIRATGHQSFIYITAKLLTTVIIVLILSTLRHNFSGICGK